MNDKTKIKRVKKATKPTKKNYKATKKDVLAMSFGVLKSPSSHIRFTDVDGDTHVYPISRAFFAKVKREGKEQYVSHMGKFDMDGANLQGALEITKEEFERVSALIA